MATLLRALPRTSRNLCNFVPTSPCNRTFRVQPQNRSSMMPILTKNAMPRWSLSIAIISRDRNFNNWRLCSCWALCEHPSTSNHVLDLTSPVPSHQNTTRHILLWSTSSRCTRKYHWRHDESENWSVPKSPRSSFDRSRLFARQDCQSTNILDGYEGLRRDECGIWEVDKAQTCKKLCSGQAVAERG